MEGMPKPERGGGREEKIEKATVVEFLKARGLEDPEALDMVLRWTRQQEAFVTAANTPAAAITFNTDRADLYLAVGDTAGALDALADARLQAYQENERELYNEIMKKMDEIEEMERDPLQKP